jgi:hypothetical protein
MHTPSPLSKFRNAGTFFRERQHNPQQSHLKGIKQSASTFLPSFPIPMSIRLFSFKMGVSKMLLTDLANEHAAAREFFSFVIEFAEISLA